MKQAFHVLKDGVGIAVGGIVVKMHPPPTAGETMKAGELVMVLKLLWRMFDVWVKDVATLLDTAAERAELSDVVALPNVTLTGPTTPLDERRVVRTNSSDAVGRWRRVSLVDSDGGAVTWPAIIIDDLGHDFFDDVGKGQYAGS